MSEGALTKRIAETLLSKEKIPFKYVPDKKPNMYKLTVDFSPVLDVLDEAKEELTSKENSTFLSDDAGGTTHIAIDIQIFKKWFGEII